MTVTLIDFAAIVPLIWSTVTDIKKRAIPAAPLILLAALGIAKVIVLWPNGLIRAGTGLLYVGLPILILSCLIDKGNSIGGGDVKLCALLGFLLGPGGALIIILGALLLLVVFSVTFRKKALPFAPFVLIISSGIFILNLISGGINV